MSGHEETARDCDWVSDELAELALGTLSGRERAEVLSHVGTCPRCSAELQRLSAVSDMLLLLAPTAEPPVGFELRLAERLRAGGSPRRSTRRHRRAGALGAAAVMTALLGFTLGAVFHPGSDNSQTQSASGRVITADLTADGHPLGNVTISPGRPAWMFVTARDVAWVGTLRCTVTLADGKVDTVGNFRLSGGYGAWGTALAAGSGQVRTVRLIAPDGVILATARLSA